LCFKSVTRSGLTILANVEIDTDPALSGALPCFVSKFFFVIHIEFFSSVCQYFGILSIKEISDGFEAIAFKSDYYELKIKVFFSDLKKNGTSQAMMPNCRQQLLDTVRAVASGRASGARPTHLRSMPPPFHAWPSGCCIHPIQYFKNVASLSGF